MAKPYPCDECGVTYMRSSTSTICGRCAARLKHWQQTGKWPKEVKRVHAWMPDTKTPPQRKAMSCLVH